MRFVENGLQQCPTGQDVDKTTSYLNQCRAADSSVLIRLCHTGTSVHPVAFGGEVPHNFSSAPYYAEINKIVFGDLNAASASAVGFDPSSSADSLTAAPAEASSAPESLDKRLAELKKRIEQNPWNVGRALLGGTAIVIGAGQSKKVPYNVAEIYTILCGSLASSAKASSIKNIAEAALRPRVCSLFGSSGRDQEAMQFYQDQVKQFSEAPTFSSE